MTVEASFTDGLRHRTVEASDAKKSDFPQTPPAVVRSIDDNSSAFFRIVHGVSRIRVVLSSLLF